MAVISLHTRKGKILAGATIGALAWVLVAGLYFGQLLETFELGSYDHLSRLHAARMSIPDNIVLVVVDQNSLEAAQRQGIGWPWPRQMYAPIVHFGALSGARAVVFDILFTEPSTYGVGDDRLLAESLEQNGHALLALFLSQNDRPKQSWESGLLRRIALPLETRAAPPASHFRALLPPIRMLADSAASLGNVEIPPDADGIYRRLRLFFHYGEHRLANLGLAVVQHLRGGELMAWDGDGRRTGTHRIPLDSQGNFLLTFYGGQGNFPRYSAFNVIQSYVALQEGAEPVYRPEIFKDKIVFVGYTAPGLFELKPTPVNSVYPGMAIHATLVANLLRQDFRQRIQPAALLALAAGVTLVTSITVLLVSNLWLLGFYTMAYAAGLCLIVVLSFWQNLWVDGILLGTSLGLAFALSTAFSYATEGRQRRQIKSMFAHYMSDVLIQDLLKHPDKLRLGGEKRQLTVFFSDLAGFTTLSEKLPPEVVVKVLNRYLTAMTDIILASGGFIDKYEGDAIMAFWGAPVPQEDHAVRACLAALDNQHRLAELRQEFMAMGLPPIYARIGINTGEMIIGNMGSTQRFDFTVMGDSVNLASRLEGASKSYGTSILLSEETYRQAAAHVEARELDLLRVKGKEVPVCIYELLARKGELEETTCQVRELFAEALQAYRQQRWTEAIDRFRQALARAPDDTPSQIFLQRCQVFVETPPPSWDGVYQLTSK